MHATMVYVVAVACVVVLALLLGMGLDLHYRAMPRRALALSAGKNRIDKLA